MRGLFCLCYRLICLFFFFQAEDGIRDLTVTGVQTCALPISGDPTLAEFVGGPGVPTEPCRAGAGVLFAKRVQLAAQRPLPIQRLGRRPPREEIGRASCRERV